MAQRDKKEEPMELHAPEIALCANSCGFPGNPATKNLCQNCFLAASASASASPPSPSSSSSSSSSSSKTAPYPVVDEPGPAAEVKAAVTMKAENPTAAGVEVRTARSANRCGSCRKRVGLTGFRCRCGDLFCGAHRYTDRHECSYDYKAAARDAIARENPVVRAAKIVRF